jgi:Carboxypeptidase regulatory-like domain/TonB dependent receptor
LRHRIIAILGVLGLALSMPSPANGQLYTGSIAGTVTDPSGALLPSVEVKATDEGKGYAFSATTDSAGRYVIRQLPPAKYTVTAEASGFATERKTGITIDVSQNSSVDFALKVGGASTIVDVTAGAVQLQTEDATTGQVINRTALDKLPLVNRDAYDLVFLTPGLVHTNANGETNGNATGVNFNSAGSRNSTADVLIDGASASNFEQNSGIQNVLYEPPLEAIEEYKVEQSNFSAEFGFAGSTIVNAITRSGTNSFHGSVYEFWRNQILDANDWFSDQAGSPIAALRRNQFGGAIGGPILKNKTFFFFDYEGLRERNANSNTFGVPTPCERGDAACNGIQGLGNFSELCTLQGFTFDNTGACSDPSGQLWDPYTGVFDPNNPNGPGATRQNFIPFNNLGAYISPGNPGNGAVLPQVAGNLIDPLAKNLFLLFPKANQPVNSLSDAQNNNFFVNGVNPSSENKLDIKIDHRFNDKNLFSAKYSWDTTKGDSLNCFGNFADPCTAGPSNGRHQVLALNYTRTISPKLLVTFTYGYLRAFDFSHGVGADFKNFSSLISGIGVPSELEQTGFQAVPFINMIGGNYGNTNIGGQPFAILREGQDSQNAAGAVSWLRGNHELKFGGDFRMHRINFVQPGWPSGEFDFDFTGTSQFANAGDYTSGGDDLASFLIGVGPAPDNAGGGCTPCFSGFDEAVSTQSFQWAAFVQDNYRVTPKLTLNIGLRYELNTPRTERFNKMDWLDPNLTSAIQFAAQPGTPGGVPLAAPLPPGASIPSVLRGGERFVGVDGNSRSNYYPDYKDVQPRFGFAYQLPHNAVMRGGYGIYFSTARSGASGTGPWGFQGFDVQPPWITVQTTPNGLLDRTPCCTLSNPAPNGVPKPPGSALGAFNDLGFAAVGPIPAVSLNTPYEQTWTFQLQKELPSKIIVDATYLGKKGTHLLFGGFRENDFLGPWVEKLSPAQIQNLTIADQQNPFFCAAPPCPATNFITNPNSGLSAQTIARYQLMLPFPQFTGFQGDSPPIANSIYHALQLRAQKDFSNGLQFLISYSFSKSIDDASAQDDSVSWTGGGTPGGSTLTVQDPNNLRAERAVSVFDIPQQLQFSYVYALPVGRAKRFGGAMHPVLDAIIGGWQTGGNWVFESGRPIIPLEGGGANPIPTYGQRPTLLAPLKRSSGSAQSATAGCLVNCTGYYANPGDLVQSADFTLGNAPRTITTVRQPGYARADLALFKEFTLREGMHLEFRAEASNALNHPDFAGPNTTAGSSNFGLITRLVDKPRQMQLGLKLNF